LARSKSEIPETAGRMINQGQGIKGVGPAPAMNAVARC
jgi:hypothetical protein